MTNVCTKCKGTRLVVLDLRIPNTITGRNYPDGDVLPCPKCRHDEHVAATEAKWGSRL